MFYINDFKKYCINYHNLKIINDFSSSGGPTGLNLGYKNLLKLINNGCPEKFKSCILDTIRKKN